jgi:hypothetical protein
MHLDTIVREIETRISRNRQYVQTALDDAQRAGHKNLSLAVDAECTRRLDAIDADKGKLERAKVVQAEESALESRLTESRSTGAYANRVSRTSVVSVTRNERTYNAGNDPRGTNFLRDVARAQIMGDAEAYSRLARHSAEERVERGDYTERAAGDLVTGTSGAGAGGLVVPQYLVELTGQAVAAKRPYADNCVKHVLPAEGMTLILPTITTPTAVGNQTTQLTTTGIGAQSLVETDVTLAVKTAAGYENVSRQAVDRGGRVSEFVLQDLMTRYATNLDSTLINEATTGLAAVALATLGAFADTQPTGAKLYPKLLACASGVEATLMGTNADVCLMHSRRFSWLSKEMTSTWPLINSSGVPVQAGGVNYGKDYGSGFRGLLPNGMAIVVDNNISTVVSSNQDEIYVVPTAECHLWEDPTRAGIYQMRADERNSSRSALCRLWLLRLFASADAFRRYAKG